MTRFSIFLPPKLYICLSVIHISMYMLTYCEGPQATVPSNLLITPSRPDIVMYNSEHCFTGTDVSLRLGTSPVKSYRSRKQNKVEYLQLLAESKFLQIDTINIMRQWKSMCWVTISPAAYKTLNTLWISFSYLLPPNL